MGVEDAGDRFSSGPSIVQYHGGAYRQGKGQCVAKSVSEKQLGCGKYQVILADREDFGSKMIGE